MSTIDIIWGVVGVAFVVDIGFQLKDRLVAWLFPEDEDDA